MITEQRPEAIIWGAGKIGRGFLAEIFNDAGYKLTFIEYFEGLVNKLKTAGTYTINKVMGQGIKEQIKITGYEVYSTKAVDTITQKIVQDNTILAIAVHQAALPEVIKVLAPGIIKKARLFPESTLNIVLCINMLHPGSYCRQLLDQNLPEDVLPYLENNIGLIESVVMRMAPEATQEMLEEDPLALLNNGYPEMPVDKKAFKPPIPNTKMFRLSDDIRAEEVRKIYTLNLAHAILAYLGTPKGFEYAADSVLDPDIRYALEGALEESGWGLAKEFGFSNEEMNKWNKEIIKSIENPALKDKLDRLGTDSRRKLKRDDRLTGPALLCMKHGETPFFLAQGIAYAFMFDQPKDEGTRQVQDYLNENGIDGAIKEFCGLNPEKPEEQELIGLIKKVYEKIKGSNVIIKDTDII
jgi:mannitol-1-phosphate 5-dehydrogenase